MTNLELEDPHLIPEEELRKWIEEFLIGKR